MNAPGKSGLFGLFAPASSTATDEVQMNARATIHSHRRM
jgi:hypothetical protein